MTRKNKHMHDFQSGCYSKGGVEICQCGKFRFTEKYLDKHGRIVEQTASVLADPQDSVPEVIE